MAKHSGTVGVNIYLPDNQRQGYNNKRQSRFNPSSSGDYYLTYVRYREKPITLATTEMGSEIAAGRFAARISPFW